MDSPSDSPIISVNPHASARRSHSPTPPPTGGGGGGGGGGSLRKNLVLNPIKTHQSDADQSPQPQPRNTHRSGHFSQRDGHLSQRDGHLSQRDHHINGHISGHSSHRDHISQRNISSAPRFRPNRTMCTLLLPLIIGICLGAVCVLLLHETKTAKPLWEPLHRHQVQNTIRHLSHYHSGMNGEGREEYIPEEDMDDYQKYAFEARLLNETEATCGTVQVAYKQWYILNHALHPEVVTEAEAYEHANKTGTQVSKFGTAASFVRWWGNAYYHGALQVLPYVHVMSMRLKHELPHLTYLTTIPNVQETISSWFGFNRSLSVSWPPPAFYVEKLYHMDMIQAKLTSGHLNMQCITYLRGAIWRKFAHPHHYDPNEQYIVVANRLGTRSITNFEQLVHTLRTEFPNEKFIRQYGDERIQEIRDTYMGAKAIIYPHGANSANIHLFAPPNQHFSQGFHIGNAAHQLHRTLVVEITWDDPKGNIWRNVGWELGQAGHDYHSVRLNCSSVVSAARAKKIDLTNMDEFLQNSAFTLEPHHIHEIVNILSHNLKQRHIHIKPSSI